MTGTDRMIQRYAIAVIGFALSAREAAAREGAKASTSKNISDALAKGGGEGIRLNIFGGDADVVVNIVTKRGGIDGGPKIPGKGGSVVGGSTVPPPPSLIAAAAAAVTGGGTMRTTGANGRRGLLPQRQSRVELEMLYLGNNRLGGTVSNNRMSSSSVVCLLLLSLSHTLSPVLLSLSCYLHLFLPPPDTSQQTPFPTSHHPIPYPPPHPEGFVYDDDNINDDEKRRTHFVALSVQNNYLT